MLGAKFALAAVKASSSVVEITGLTTDTNPSIVAAAMRPRRVECARGHSLRSCTSASQCHGPQQLGASLRCITPPVNHNDRFGLRLSSPCFRSQRLRLDERLTPLHDDVLCEAMESLHLAHLAGCFWEPRERRRGRATHAGYSSTSRIPFLNAASTLRWHLFVKGKRGCAETCLRTLSDSAWDQAFCLAPP